MEHRLSVADRDFVRRFESCAVEPGDFHHREHLRLAYALLTLGGIEEARSRLKQDLFRFISHHRGDPAKYHETLTTAWILAVHHFMGRSEPARDWQEFIDRNPVLLDKEILFTHYSRELMGSEAARTIFVEPDLEPIPPEDHGEAGRSGERPRA